MASRPPCPTRRAPPCCAPAGPPPDDTGSGRCAAPGSASSCSPSASPGGGSRAVVGDRRRRRRHRAGPAGGGRACAPRRARADRACCGGCCCGGSGPTVGAARRGRGLLRRPARQVRPRVGVERSPPRRSSGRRHGVPARSSVTASALFLLLHTVTGLLLGGLLVCRGRRSTPPRPAGAWLLPVAVGAVALAPPVLRLLADRLAGPAVRATFGVRDLAASAALMAAVWACYGAGPVAARAGRRPTDLARRGGGRVRPGPRGRGAAGASRRPVSASGRRVLIALLSPRSAYPPRPPPRCSRAWRTRSPTSRSPARAAGWARRRQPGGRSAAAPEPARARGGVRPGRGASSASPRGAVVARRPPRLRRRAPRRRVGGAPTASPGSTTAGLLPPRPRPADRSPSPTHGITFTRPAYWQTRIGYPLAAWAVSLGGAAGPGPVGAAAGEPARRGRPRPPRRPAGARVRPQRRGGARSRRLWAGYVVGVGQDLTEPLAGRAPASARWSAMRGAARPRPRPRADGGRADPGDDARASRSRCWSSRWSPSRGGSGRRTAPPWWVGAVPLVVYAGWRAWVRARWSDMVPDPPSDNPLGVPRPRAGALPRLARWSTRSRSGPTWCCWCRPWPALGIAATALRRRDGPRARAAGAGRLPAPAAVPARVGPRPGLPAVGLRTDAARAGCCSRHSSGAPR